MSMNSSGSGPEGLAESSASPTHSEVQKMLDENANLIQTIESLQCQGKGKDLECVQYQEVLLRNLTYLATLAEDEGQDLLEVLPPPDQAANNIQGPAPLPMEKDPTAGV